MIRWLFIRLSDQEKSGTAAGRPRAIVKTALKASLPIVYTVFQIRISADRGERKRSAIRYFPEPEPDK